MVTLPIAAIAVRRSTDRIVNSALPTAPVVPDAPRTQQSSRVWATRGALAATLRRAADVVAPPSCSPAH